MERIVGNQVRTGRRAFRLAIAGLVAVSMSTVLVAHTLPSAVSAGTFPGANGHIVYLGDGNQIHLVDIDGSNDQVILDGTGSGGVGIFSSFAVSPDGTRLVLATTGAAHNGYNSDIYTADIDGTDLVQLTTAPGEDYQPTWSPDSGMIYFVSNRDNSKTEIFRMNADGSNQARVGAVEDAYYPSLSPDGTKVVFTQRPPGANASTRNIYVMSTSGANLVRLTTNGDYAAAPSWSPDGSKILFNTYSSTMRVWVMNSDGTSPAMLADPGNFRDQSVAWSPDGTKIAITRNDGGALTEVYVLDADGSNASRLDGSVPERDSRGNRLGDCLGIGQWAGGEHVGERRRTGRGHGLRRRYRATRDHTVRRLVPHHRTDPRPVHRSIRSAVV